ncbi:hypothetical protein ILYODFUR_020113 [Ilyodon furcidens]|uniref:Secreted protein n=1 Tax=Ilyodon furcidens TaxID=33524 RepID=A0ABV0U867_9TELE
MQVSGSGLSLAATNHLPPLGAAGVCSSWVSLAKLSTLRRSNTLQSSKLQAVLGEAFPWSGLCSHLPAGSNLAPTSTSSWSMVPFSPFPLN